MAIYKSRNYQSLAKFLERSLKIKSSKANAHLLLHKFAVDAVNPTSWQYFCFDELKQKGILKYYGTFAAWRREMIDKGVLICMANDADISKKVPVYQANMFKFGPKIRKYMESELHNQKSVFERIDELNEKKADTKQVLDLEKRMEEKMDKIFSLILKMNPPDTPERRRILREHYEDNDKCHELLRQKEGML